ncbi:MAG: RHS repeat-associated core domain-containing protein [Acidobacteria bacterium]|nr:RHS repeat-associated core domain-containing protein [Acidobacteriota bacterium]
MELSIPLGGYAGRAGNGLSNTLTYSSKVWGLRNTDQWQSGLGFTINDVKPIFSKHSTAGWTSSLGTPQIEYEWDRYQASTQESGTYDGQIFAPAHWEDPPNAPLFYIKRPQVRMPDDSTHELRASDAAINCGTISSGCTSYDFTGTFLSVDGTRMRLDSGLSSSTLYMPDGSRYEFGAQTTGLVGNPATTYYDRHGNKMTFSTSARTWTDTMGRSLVDPTVTAIAVPTGADQTASYPGIGSTPYELDFVWNDLSNAFENTSDVVRYDSNKLCNGNIHTSQTPYLFSATEHETRLCSSTGSIFDPLVLTKITLPNGQYYEFKYNVYGEITKIRYPTGAYERFIYSLVAPITVGSPTYDVVNRGVTDRYVSVKGDGTDETHSSYTVSRGTLLSPTPYTITTYAPDDSITQQVIHDEPNLDVWRPYGFGNAVTGRAYDERVYDNSSSHHLRSRKLTSYEQTGPLAGGQSEASRDMRPSTEVSIIFEPGETNALATMTGTVYDTAGNSDPAYFSSLNPKQVKTYHYVSVNASTAATASIGDAAAWFTGATPAVVHESDYLYDSGYKNRNINGLVTETRVEDASGNAKAKSQITYDGVSLLSESTSSRWVNPNTNYRGLVTGTRTWHDIANNLYIDTQAQYDLMGNLRYATDGRGNVSQTVYSSTYDYAFPTSVITPIPDSSGVTGSNAAFTSSTVYDYNTGLPTSSTDINGQTSYMEYNDALLRSTKVTAPNGHQTITEYGAGTSASTRWVKSRSQIDASSWKEGYSYFDGLGRAVRSQSIDDDGDVFSLTCYDTMGRVSKATNPFRGYTNQDCSTTTGLDWTTNTFDTAGRPWKVTTPDGAVVETLYGLATSGSQIGSVVTVKDQALKERRSVTNALGQLIRVDEPTTAGLGAIDTPNQPTYYVYDTLNNLTTVKQGGTFASPVQTRSFVYDSLARLKSATNPESGQIQYTYDNNGNLVTKTDARSISTTYSYDNLNRITLRNYSETTADVSYYYDNLSNAKGKLTKVASNVSTTEYLAFDLMGRVTRSKQTTDGVEYGGGSDPNLWMTYTYNLSGALVEQQYPTGRVVKNTLDPTGDLAMVQSKKNAASGYWNYADSFSYNPAGALTTLQLGNGKWESTVFNSRLQPTQIALGTVQNGTDKLELDYTYGTTANNGNVLTQTITVPGMTHPLIQNYTYDALNRLDDANETSNGTQTWRQDFTFDRYGNRNFVEANTTMPSSFANPAVSNPAISTTNNRITSTGFLYDTAGNTTRDAAYQTFTYDAENKQTEVKNSSSAILGQYSYDGDGKRVKKYVPASGETTVFVYDVTGKSIAEYSTIIASANDAKVAYLTNDHLGSPRINTDANGVITSRHDYLPFGEEILSSLTSQRAGVGYGGDSVRKRFTGYERDDETGLDYAIARTYATSIGRFTAPDEIVNDSVIQDPQSWNKYAYVRNNPIAMIDPSGQKAQYIITVDTKNKRLTVTAIATIGVWSKTHGKGDLNKAAKKIEAGIESKWKGNWKEDGWKVDFNAQVSVQVFDKAKGVADVQAKDSSIMNIVELADIHGKEASHVEQNKTQTVVTQANPDGTRPDVARWDYSNAIQSGPNYEPTHEFAHILGSPNGGKTGTDLHAPGIGQAASMSVGDFNSAIGYTANLYRDQYQKFVATHPNAPAKATYRGIYRLCCHQ